MKAAAVIRLDHFLKKLISVNGVPVFFTPGVIRTANGTTGKFVPTSNKIVDLRSNMV